MSNLFPKLFSEKMILAEYTLISCTPTTMSKIDTTVWRIFFELGSRNQKAGLSTISPLEECA